MTFWGWILAIVLCFSLLGFIIQAAEYVVGFNFDNGCKKRASARRGNAAKDATQKPPKADKEPGKESEKASESGSLHIRISGTITVHTQDSQQPGATG